jgi:hypothetical protein
MSSALQLKRSIQRWLVFFIIALVMSGLTAFPIETELQWICSWWPEKQSSFYNWLITCRDAIASINTHFPFLAYGYDWLASAHLVIAVAFIGPLKDPVRNIWILQFGMISCILIIPLALLAGQIRNIPFYWTLIDSSFGVLGIIPLFICYRKTLLLEHLNHSTNKA